MLAGVLLPNNRPPPWAYIVGVLISFTYMFGTPIAVLYVLFKRRRGAEAVVTYVVMAYWLGSMAWVARMLAGR